MSCSWERGAPWCEQLPKFQQDLQKWNKEVFGNIFQRKRDLVAQLDEVAQLLTINPSEALERKHKDIWKEYEKVLFQEEVLWYQKSRTKWVHYGDRNTHFFHGTTTIKKRKNTYDMLQDSKGNWIGDQTQLEAMVTNYFTNLFTDSDNFEQACISGAFPALSEIDKSMLARAVIPSEIFNVITHMGAFKAPGPDGLQVAFYQSQWQFVGESICNLVRNIFNDPAQVNEINETFLSLIPKGDQVCHIKDFRLISLCNVSYKVITKIMAQCLRTIMGMLISPCQISFVPNRQSRDNIVIA